MVGIHSNIARAIFVMYNKVRRHHHCCVLWYDCVCMIPHFFDFFVEHVSTCCTANDSGSFQRFPNCPMRQLPETFLNSGSPIVRRVIPDVHHIATLAVVAEVQGELCSASRRFRSRTPHPYVRPTGDCFAGKITHHHHRRCF